jgi:hypothetical protein
MENLLSVFRNQDQALPDFQISISHPTFKLTHQCRHCALILNAGTAGHAPQKPYHNPTLDMEDLYSYVYFGYVFLAKWHM